MFRRRNPDFPNTFIQTVAVDLTSPMHAVSLDWYGSLSTGQPTGPFHSSPGAGRGFKNCDDLDTSRTPESNCTPKGTFVVEGVADRLPSFANCLYVTWFDTIRGLAIHGHAEVPDYPASHGCIRLNNDVAELVHDNVLVGVTKIAIGGTWSPFAPLPDVRINIGWPTSNQSLFTIPEKFFSRTRANPNYGKPGATRDCGRRIHRGCDIAPLNTIATGEFTVVEFTDCAAGVDYESREAVFLPLDDVFSVADGNVLFTMTQESESLYGLHVVIEHSWPDGSTFRTLYGHLAELYVIPSEQVTLGQRIGRMGQSSMDPDARNWMAIAPHLHFEVSNSEGVCYNPAEFLKKYLSNDHLDSQLNTVTTIS